MKKQNRWRRLLRKAANFFEKGEDNWTKGGVAKNQNDFIVSTLNPTACKFCMIGAIAKCDNLDIISAPAVLTIGKASKEAYRNLLKKGFGLAFNDSDMTTKEQVIAKLREVADSD